MEILNIVLIINKNIGEIMLKNIGIIGDIHTESKRLQKILEFMQTLTLDGILCVGDIVDGSGDVNKCCELLQQYNVRIVLGNHDEWFLSNSMRDLPDATPIAGVNEESDRFIRNLPLEMEFKTTSGDLLLCHGLGKKTMGKVRDDDYGYALESNFELQELINKQQYRFVINGHTHYAMVRDFGNMTVINAGSLLYENPCFLTIDFTKKFARFYTVDTPVPGIQKEIPL
jgi:putative phosphoesterase